MMCSMVCTKNVYTLYGGSSELQQPDNIEIFVVHHLMVKLQGGTH